MVGGVVAGVVGAGGSRIAMRVAALTADPCRGVLTENDNLCGVFTLEGTIGLIMFGGIFFGTAGGVAYAALSPWLRPLGRWRGLAFGFIVLAMLGFTVIESDNPDFDRFGSPALNVAMFALVFLLFGLVVAPVYDAVTRRLPGLPPRWPIRLSALGYGVMAFTVFAIFLFGVGTIGLGIPLLAALAVMHELGEAATRARHEGRMSTAMRAAYALPLIFVVAGTVITIGSIVRIL